MCRKQLQAPYIVFTFLSPAQDCPSPVNPALHVQVKEPIVFWQTALASQGEERHSLISMHRKEIHKNNQQTQTLPGEGSPFFGLNGYVPPNRVWFRGCCVLNRVYNVNCIQCQGYTTFCMGNENQNRQKAQNTSEI